MVVLEMAFLSMSHFRESLDGWSFESVSLISRVNERGLINLRIKVRIN